MQVFLVNFFNLTSHNNIGQRKAKVKFIFKKFLFLRVSVVISYCQSVIGEKRVFSAFSLLREHATHAPYTYDSRACRKRGDAHGRASIAEYRMYKRRCTRCVSLRSLVLGVGVGAVRKKRRAVF